MPLTRFLNICACSLNICKIPAPTALLSSQNLLRTGKLVIRSRNYFEVKFFVNPQAMVQNTSSAEAQCDENHFSFCHIYEFVGVIVWNSIFAVL